MSKQWYIPDCYYQSISHGEFVSHEAICVLNPTKTDAKVSLTLYFEDKDPIGGFEATIGAERTNHIRMDKLKSKDGAQVPTDTPYAVIVASECEDLYVQYTRVDSSQDPLAICTTIV